MEKIVNKVAESGIITLDLADYMPNEKSLQVFDLKPFLFMEMILKEKDFRAALQTHDWSQYQNKYVTINCSADAIIPMWAYMLVAVYLQPVANKIFFGTEDEMKNQIIIQNLSSIDSADFIDKRVVVKGCGDVKISEAAYVQITALLTPVVKSLMYGEPCSTVPIYKKRN